MRCRDRRTAAEIPQFATHYHLADSAPFLSLSEAPEDELSAVLEGLAERRAAGGLHRVFGSRYMELRRLTEEKLHRSFVEAGGTPRRRVPHYFVLGECEWFRQLAADMREVVVPLAALPDDVTSFTYPDSFTAMGLGRSFGLAYRPRPYHGRVFRMSELEAVVARYGHPDGDPDPVYEGYQHREFEKYIEIQLWCDEPVASHVARR